MLLEPPGPHVPPRRRLSTPALLRLAAATTALVLAVSSRGDAIGLAVALGLSAWRPAPAIAVAGALTATSWRWGSSSLEAISGAQAVLGPAGWVGPPLAATGSWLAAAAIVAACPSRAARGQRLLAALASGAAAAVVVAGPAPGGDLWARLLVGLVGAALAYAVGTQRGARRWGDPLADGVALLSAVAAVACIAQDARRWAGTLTGAAIGEGAAVGLATAGVVVAVLLGRTAMEQRRP